MYATNILHSQTLFQNSPPSQSHLSRLSPIFVSPIRSKSSGSSSSNGGKDGGNPPPDDAVEIRFRRGSRRRQRQLQLQTSTNEQPKKPAAPPKSWEEMTLSEKAMEIYVGEKGLLFWLNKFAYASIFIVIGAWIVFRFVGPSLNLYQLDSPPLSPNSMFKG